MNLVEQLLKADVAKTKEYKTGVFESERLAEIIGMKPGEDEKKPTVPVQIRQINPRRMNDIAGYQLKANGQMDFGKTFDAALMACIEGVVDPPLTDKDLQAHFGCSSAKALAETLFHEEVQSLSDAISDLSTVTKTNEDDVKN